MNPNLNSSLSLDFLGTLKTKTAASHKRLEKLPVSSSILSSEMKIQDYTRYLMLMYDVHHSVEEQVFPLLEHVFEDLTDRTKKYLIEEDLAYLHYPQPVAKSVFNTENITVAFACGILYVIEGSSLGGRFILKNVESVPGLHEGKGVSYFTGYGNKTGSRWNNFLKVLTKFEEENNGEEIIKGAIYAFDCIHNHFLQEGINEN